MIGSMRDQGWAGKRTRDIGPLEAWKRRASPRRKRKRLPQSSGWAGYLFFFFADFLAADVTAGGESKLFGRVGRRAQLDQGDHVGPDILGHFRIGLQFAQRPRARQGPVAFEQGLHVELQSVRR